MRYRIFLTIKLLISRHVFLYGEGSSRPSSLFLYVCLFVDVDMVTKNGCSYVLSCVKTCVVSTVWQEITQSFDPHLQPSSIHNAFINSQWRHYLRMGDVISDVIPLTCVKTSKNIVKTVNSCCA